MTDMLSYQDVFKTNIPELDQNVSLHAKYLLGAAQNNDPENSDIMRYRRSYIDTPEVTQAIWELRDEPEASEKKKLERPKRLLAITVMGSYYRIGIDRQPTAEHPDPVRFSVSGNWMTGPKSTTDQETHGETVYDIFYDTVAALGLHNRLVAVFGAQKESSSESFANAA